MMNEIQIFNSPEFGEIRTVMIDNEPWFVGKDVAVSLGYKSHNQSLKDNVPEEDRGVSPVMTPSGMQNMVIINESGLYSLIFGSKLESAKKFKRWVTSEVLPQLRKTGSYGMAQLPMSTQDQIKLLAQGNVELNQRVGGLEEKFRDFENNLPLLPVDAKTISDQVKRKAYAIMGGRDSKAYKNNSIRRSVFRNLYIGLNYNFGTHRYEEIRRMHKEKAIQFVLDWKPPFFLAEEIDRENATI